MNDPRHEFTATEIVDLLSDLDKRLRRVAFLHRSLSSEAPR